MRQPRFIYDWLFWRWWQPPAKEMEIAHGEIKTGKDGKFEIDFMALPDLSIDKKFDPVFDYRIYSDVTDINGETRSGETAISVSYQSLMLNVSVPEKLPLDSLKNIFISTTNIAGEFEPAKVSVQVYKLKAEDRLIRNRYWQRPDQFVMTKEEYIKWFPNDEYNFESDYKNREKEKKFFEKTDSSNRKSAFSIQNVAFDPGFYVIEVTTKDKDGQEVKDVKYVELYDEKSNRVDQPQYFWTDGSKPIEPGEKTTIRIGSSANDVFLVQEINKKQADDGQTDIGDYSSIKLNNEKKTFDFAATENDRGGYGVSYFFVKNNRSYVYNDVIQVPWTNKELNVEYATFRDKVLPGSEEKWKIKISGYKNEKIAGEMLASMYDASLDQFKPHSWFTPSIWPYYSDYSNWNGNSDFSTLESEQKQIGEEEMKYPEKQYDVLFGNFNSRSNIHAFRPSPTAIKSVNQDTDELRVDGSVMKKELTGSVSKVIGRVVSSEMDSTKTIGKQPPIQNNSPVQIRKNFNETAFFFPDLRTDSTGVIEFSFTIPEALTKWKLQTLVHTKDLAFGSSTKEIVTQKQLMVQPNAPRFLREGDRMEFSAKVVNLTDSEFTGQAQLQLIDATTDQSIDGWFQNVFPNQYFTVAAGQSEVVKFPIQIPYLFNKAMEWRIVARAGNFSDGEEDALAVLTNKTLVTETLPLNMKGSGKKNFTFEKLLHTGESETLQNYALTVEYTSNPAWYAVQSLPYLMEYPYECAEQTWNRYYANSLASMIANASPRIKEIFEQWKTKDTSALLSNLQKNQELKSVLLEETPWVLDAKSEEQQKKNIALLFDMVKMSQELNGSLDKLKQMQSENGGFVWFTDGPDDRYITQYIVTGIGHLKKLKAFAS
ncbi:MAG TPA: alpha-2-macroglobulin family protein, partial [Chitinophagaceae bacterium]|nr:alpha-2-macroglobulin family protein [Chitinophagaceae bacterium]